VGLPKISTNNSNKGWPAPGVNQKPPSTPDDRRPRSVRGSKIICALTCSCKTIRKLLLLVRRTGNLCSLLVFILQEHRHQYNNITVVTTIFRFARTFSHSGFYVSVERSYETRKRKRPTGTEQANDLTTPDGLRSAKCDSSVQWRRRDRRFPGISAALTFLRCVTKDARARARLLPDVPTTAHASPRYDVHAEPVVVVVVVVTRRIYGATVKRALNNRCFF